MTRARKKKEEAAVRLPPFRLVGPASSPGRFMVGLLGINRGFSGRASLTVRKMTRMRLHTRTIIRDGHQAFVGSQSLRPAELDSRREVGLIVRESGIVKKLLATFEADWSSDGVSVQETPKEEAPTILYANVGRSILSDEGFAHTYAGIGVKFLLVPKDLNSSDLH